MSAGDFFGGLSRGFAGTFSEATSAKKKRQADQAAEDKRLAQQKAQFDQTFGLQQQQFEESKKRNELLDKLMVSREGRDVAAEARTQEAHDVQFGWLRDPVARDTFMKSEMSKLKAPIFQLQKLEFDTGNMADVYQRGKATEQLENDLKKNQMALNDQTLAMSKHNLRVAEDMAPLQKAAAELENTFNQWRTRPENLSRQEALQDAQLHASKLGTLQTIHLMALSNAQEGREYLRLGQNEARAIAESVATISTSMPGATPDEKLENAQKFVTKAYGLASDLMNKGTIGKLGGPMTIAPDYEQFKKDAALVATGMNGPNRATPDEVKAAVDRTDAFAAKIATADPHQPQGAPTSRPSGAGGSFEKPTGRTNRLSQLIKLSGEKPGAAPVAEQQLAREGFNKVVIGGEERDLTPNPQLPPDKRDIGWLWDQWAAQNSDKATEAFKQYKIKYSVKGSSDQDVDTFKNWMLDAIKHYSASRQDMYGVKSQPETMFGNIDTVLDYLKEGKASQGVFPIAEPVAPSDMANPDAKPGPDYKWKQDGRPGLYVTPPH